MAVSRKIRIMISSRSKASFASGAGSPKLATIRMELKEEIEAEKLFGEASYEVWINEKAPPQGTWDISDTCTQAVKDCDVLIALYNGDAGWATEAGDIGICHDELSMAYSTAPGKVRLIMLPLAPNDDKKARERNKRFQDYVEAQHPFAGGEVRTVEDLKQRVREALRDAVVTLTQSGVLEAGRGRRDVGDALKWTQMNFDERRKAITGVLRDSIGQRSAARQQGANLFWRVDDKELLFVVDAIPAAMSVAAAREMVGQPFLRDHEHVPSLTGDRGGPVHVIGCHKTVTETQATKLLGFPDATVVTTQFGVYVADNVQKIQLVLIANCCDDANTRHGVQRFFDWLRQTGEGSDLAKRAAARGRIVRQIAKELAGESRPSASKGGI
jgi:hypothetical protein